MCCHSFINFSLCTNKQILYFISFEDFQKNTYLYHFKVTEKTTKMLILRYASLWLYNLLCHFEGHQCVSVCLIFIQKNLERHSQESGHFILLYNAFFYVHNLNVIYLILTRLSMHVTFTIAFWTEYKQQRSRPAVLANHRIHLTLTL